MPCSRSVLRSIATLLLFVTPLAAAGPEAAMQPSVEELEALETLTTEYLTENLIPGGVVSVASEGKILYSRTYGLANVELEVPVTTDTVFEIGSISKQFVSLVTLRLVERQVLGLEQRLGAHIPEVPGDWQGVTLRQLLTHTSGIPDYEAIRGYDVYQSRLTADEVLAIAHSRPMDFAPGTGFHYSNTAYYLMSLILERVEGKPLGEILEAHVFGPLGMDQTRMADPEAIIRQRASGYWTNKVGELINRSAIHTSSTLGAGGIVSTIGDMALWDEALNHEELLSAESKEILWTPVTLPDGTSPRWSGGESLDYAMGWVVTPYRGLAMQSHSGQTAGFVGNFARFPESKLSVLVLVNLYDVGAWPLLRETVHAFVPGLEPIDESSD